MNDIELSVGFNQADVDKGIKKIETQIKQTQTALKRSSDTLDALEAQQKDIISRLEIEKSLHGQNAKSIKSICIELDDVNKKLSEEYMIHDRIQEELIQEQQIRKQLYLNPTDYVNQTSQVENNTRSISNNLKQSNKEAKSLSSIGNKIHKSFSDALLPIKSMATRIIGLTKRVLFFSVITSSLSSFRDYMGEAINSNAQFSNSLAVVRENLSTAFASIFSAVLPALQSFMDWLGRATAYMASFIATLFGSTYKAAQKTAKSFKTQSKATKNLTKDTKKLNKEMSKQLANFDELNVLSQEISDNADSGNEPKVIGGGDSGGAVEPIMPDYESEISSAEAFANKIRSIFSGMNGCFDPITEALGRLWEKLKLFKEPVLNGLNYTYNEILKPFGAWLAQELIPTSLDSIGDAFSFVGESVGTLEPSWEEFSENVLKPFASDVGNGVIETIQSIGNEFKTFTNQLEEDKDTIQSLFHKINKIMEYTYQVGIRPILAALFKTFKETFENVCESGAKFVSGLIHALDGLLDFLKGIFTRDTETAFKGLKNFFIGIANSIISVLEMVANLSNEPIKFILRKFKYMVDGLNKIPGVNIDFNVWEGPATLHLPRIPYLAQGAVIPPNREFLAMLGDQKRGTNIETPLETMKDAFRDVMSEFNNRGNGEYTFIAKLDSREIFRETVRQNEMYKKRIGRNAFA